MPVYRLSQLGQEVQEDLELVENLQGPFATSKTYNIGALVTFQGFLWRCHTPVVEPGDWTGALNWIVITLQDLLNTKQDILNSANVNQGVVTEVIGFNALNDLVREHLSLNNPIVVDETLIL